jgi:cytidylate kinase
MGFIVAIDGPAGSGKSTVAKQVAKRLQLSYVDTGAIYRSLALHTINANVEETDDEAIAKLADDLPLEIFSDSHGQRFFLDGKDVSEAIRSERVSRLASVVSSHQKVRDKLLELQRRLGWEAKKGAVLEGRDIGTVVFPDAQFKFFLTASNEERAKRRFEELKQRGEDASFENVLREIIERDERDSKRDAAPMVPAADSQIIDTTLLSLDKVIDSIVSVIHESN